MITYRKTKRGEWVAYGPSNEMHTGDIKITKKSGDHITRCIERLGKPFSTPSGDMVYGYLADDRRSRPPRARTTRSKDWPGKDCPCCGSEPLDARLSCWECGYQGSM